MDYDGRLILADYGGRCRRCVETVEDEPVFIRNRDLQIVTVRDRLGFVLQYLAREPDPQDVSFVMIDKVVADALLFTTLVNAIEEEVRHPPSPGSGMVSIVSTSC